MYDYCSQSRVKVAFWDSENPYNISGIAMNFFFFFPKTLEVLSAWASPYQWL